MRHRTVAIGELEDRLWRPIKVCSRGCQFAEPIELVTRGEEGRRWPISMLLPKTVLRTEQLPGSARCPLCGAKLAERCPDASCDAAIKRLDDTHCRSCGRLYYWTLERQRRTRTRHFDWVEGGAIAVCSIDSHALWIWRGDLRDIGIDAVVVTDDELGYMRGEAARQLKLEWGEEIEQISVAKGPHKLGSAWSTAAGPHAPVDLIIHCATMDRKKATTKKRIASATFGALAEADYLWVRAVAFSALGTGSAAFDPKEAAKAMAAAIKRYFREHPDSRIHDLVFVLFEKTFEDFKTGLEEAFHLVIEVDDTAQRI